MKAKQNEMQADKSKRNHLKSAKSVVPDFRQRYERMAQSDWFKDAYKGRSIGEVMEIMD